MKQQILWVVEYQSMSTGKWFIAEACFTRRDAREVMASWRRMDNYVRVVKFSRSE